MKNLLTVACFVILPLSSTAQGDRYKQITDPNLTSINRETPRSTFTSYTNEKDATDKQPQRRYSSPLVEWQMEIQLCRQLLYPPY